MRSTEAVSQARTTIADWNTANEQLQDVIVRKYHDEIYSSPCKRSLFQASTSSNSIERLYQPQ